MTEELKTGKTEYSGISVLIFGAGGRQTLPMCRGFYKLGCRVTVYCSRKADTGYQTRFKHEKILYKAGNKYGEDYLSYGARLIKTGKFDLVVPMGDKTAMYLSQHKEELGRHAKIAVNDRDIFQNVIDKSRTMKICEENGIPAPKTLYTDDPAAEIREKGLSYPVVVKPKTGVGSIGFNIVKNEERLIKLLEGYDNSNGPLLVQEYVEQGDQPQYRVDLFRTYKGEFKMGCAGKVTRWYPLDGGSGIFIQSIRDDKMINDCKKLLDALDWIGYANIDLVFDEKAGEAKVLEINGRPGASIMIDYVCGINVSQLILENELGYDVTDMTEYTEGKRTSCLLPDMLWLLKSKGGFRTKLSWFNRIGVKDVIFSWDDPIPTFGFLFESLTTYRSSMNKRKRVK